MNRDRAVAFWRTGGAFLLIAALYGGARLWRLTAYSLRPDEIFSLRIARHDWIGLLGAAVHDAVHPPLFYLLLKAWIGLGGESELWLRLLPVLFALATPVPLLLLGRQLRLPGSAINLGLLLMAVNAYLIYYAQELRMYSLVPLLTLCSLWLFMRFKDDARDEWEPLISLFLANVLLVFAHYFGWLVVAGEGLVLIVCRRDSLRPFLLSALALLLLFSPWALLVTRALLRRGGLESNIGSFPRPTLVGDLGGYYATLAGALNSQALSVVGMILINVPVLVLALRRRKVAPPADNECGREAFWFLALFAFMPVLVAFMASQVLPQSIWGTRLLVLSAAPYLLLVAVGFDALRPRWLRRAAVVLAAAYAVVAGVHGLNHSGKNQWQPLVQRMMEAEASRESGILVYAFGSMDETIKFYAGEAGERRLVTKRIRDADAMQGEHFWVAFRDAWRPYPPDVLRAGGYRVGDAFRDGFGGVLLPAWRETRPE